MNRHSVVYRPATQLLRLRCTSRPREHSTCRGFTLVELMVALALAAIISMSIMFISSQSKAAYDETVKKVDVYSRFRFAFNALQSDIEGAIPSSEMEFYTDGRGRGARLNLHWDPGEEVPDRRDENGAGVVDGGVVGDFDEYASVAQAQYWSTEPGQTSEKLHDAYRFYFRTLTFIDGAVREANVEYFLLDTSRMAAATGGEAAGPQELPFPTKVAAEHVQDLALVKIVRYFKLTPDLIKRPMDTPVVRKIVEVCSNVTDFRVEYLVEKDRDGRVTPGFRTPEAEYRNPTEPEIRPRQDAKLGVNGGYRKFFGYGSVKLGQNYSLAIAEPGLRSDDGLWGLSNPRPLRVGFRGNPQVFFAELIPGDKIFIFTASERGEISQGAGAATAGNATKLTRFPSGDYTIRANFQGFLEFEEDIDTTEWSGKTQSGIYYKAPYVPSAFRITIRIVDDRGENPKTMQREIWVRRRSR